MVPDLTAPDEELKKLAESARQYIPERVQYYAPKVGVDYGSFVTVRCQKFRWGSYSNKGNLSFNCLLMLAPRRSLTAWWPMSCAAGRG